MNIVDFVILFIFIVSLFRGYHLGLIRQSIHFLGFFIAFYLAYQFSGTLAPYLTDTVPAPDFNKTSLYMFYQTLDLESMYYNAIAFIFIFFVAKLLLIIGGHILDQIANLPGLASMNRFFGAIIGLVQAGLIVLLFLHVITVMPWQELHVYIYDSPTATSLMQITPVLTDMLYQLWNSSTGELYHF